MDINLVKMGIDQILNLENCGDIVTVEFSGGEPLLQFEK